MFTFWNTVVSWFFFLAGAQSKTSQHRETDSKLAALETLPESQFEMEGGVFQRFEIGVLTTSNVDRIYRVRSHWEARDIHCLLWVRDQIGIRTTSTVGHTHDEYCGHMYRVRSHWEVHDIHVPRWVRDEIGMLTTSNVSRMYRVRSHREARDIHVLNWVRDEIGMLTTSSVDCMYRVRSHWEAHDIDGLLWVREEIGIRATSDVGCMYRVRSHRVGRDMHVLHWIHDIDVLHYLGRCLAQAMWTVIQTVIQVIIINTKLMLCL